MVLEGSLNGEPVEWRKIGGRGVWENQQERVGLFLSFPSFSRATDFGLRDFDGDGLHFGIYCEVESGWQFLAGLARRKQASDQCSLSRQTY